MADPKPQQEATSAIGAVEASDFDSLLRKEFKPKTDEAKEAVEKAVRTLEPDHGALRRTGVRGVIVTSRVEGGEFDFVSRFFAPGAGIDEDPVTG